MPTYKIQHAKTGKFSRGGGVVASSTSGWTAHGKTWATSGAVRLSLRVNVSSHANDQQVRKVLADMEVVEYDGGDTYWYDAADFLLKTGQAKRESLFLPAAMRPQLGVIAIVFNKDGDKVLMGQRRTSSGLMWEFPGGKVDPFERMAEAVLREVREECGIDCLFAPYLGAGEPHAEPIEMNEYIDPTRNQHFVGAVYVLDHVSGDPRPEPGEYGHEWVWVDLNQIPTPLFYDTLDIKRFGGTYAVTE